MNDRGDSGRIGGLTRIVAVLGCQRSGTTLTGHLLGAPRDALLLDERDGFYDWIRDGAAEDEALQHVLAAARTKYTDPETRVISDAAGRYRPAAQIRTLVLKAPNLTYTLSAPGPPALPGGARLAVAFPVRDPRAVVASILALPQIDFVGNQRRLLSESALAGQFSREIAELGDASRPDWQRMAVVWRVKTGFFTHWQSAAAPVPAHVFAYEDLVARPEAVLRALTGALGLRFDLAMLDHAGIYTGRSQGNFDRTRPIDRVSTEGWRDRLNPEQQTTILDIAGPVAEELGYA